VVKEQRSKMFTRSQGSGALIVATLLTVLSVASAIVWAIVTRVPNHELLAVEHRTGVFYCNLALMALGETENPTRLAEKESFIQRRLFEHARLFSAYVRQEPRRYGLGDVNALTQALVRLRASAGADSRKECDTETDQVICEALEHWCVAHPSGSERVRLLLRGARESGSGNR